MQSFMNEINDWFTKFEDLDSLDNKISELSIPNDSLEISSGNDESFLLEKLVGEIEKCDDLASFQQLIANEKESIAKFNFETSVHKKLGLLTLGEKVKEHDAILANVNKLTFDAEDKFNKTFFFDSEIDYLTELIKTVHVFVSHGRADLKEFVEYGSFSTELEHLASDIFSQISSKVQELKKIFITLLKPLIEESNWVQEPTINETLKNDILHCCENFNYLQNIDVICNKLTELPVIWSVEVILQPIITKFIFHFFGKKMTNKISQPELATEYCLGYLQDDAFLQKMASFFGASLKLNKSTLNSKISLFSSSNIASFDGCSIIIETIKVFNKFLSIKFTNDLKTSRSHYFNTNSRLFTNLLYQLNNYETTIFETYLYNDGNLLMEILTTNNNWNQWVTLEKTHIINNFTKKFPTGQRSVINLDEKNGQVGENDELILEDESFNIEFDSVKPTSLKPTKISVNFMSLLKNLIELIVSLRITTEMKSTLLFELVNQLLDLYHDNFAKLLANSRIASNNSNYLNSLITNSLISFNKKQKTDSSKVSNEDGVLNEIVTLVKIYCSVKYVMIKLEQYNQNIELIKIFEHLKANVADEQFILDHFQVRDELRMMVSDEFQSIFDYKISKFAAIIDEVLSTLTSFLRKSLKIYLRNYLNLTGYWNESLELNDDWGFGEDLDTELDSNKIEGTGPKSSDKKPHKFTSFRDKVEYNMDEDLELTKEIKSPINILILQLKFLKKCIGGNSYLSTIADYRAIEIGVLKNLMYYFHSYIIKLNKFNLQGARQLKYDYLFVVGQILKRATSDDPELSTKINFRQYKDLEEQKFLVKILDCCNVLMLNSEVLSEISGKSFQVFRNQQDFSSLKQFFDIKTLSDDEIYHLVSYTEFY